MALAFVLVFVPFSVRADVSDYWAEEDVDMRLEPHYENIAYTLDPIVTLQRFDAKGDWYWPATTVMDDSKLDLTGATNASLHVAAAAGLDDGMYYEARMIPGAASNTTFALWNDDAANVTSINLAANNYAFAVYKDSVGAGTTTSLIGAWVAATPITVGILFDGVDLAFYAWHDNGTEIGHVAGVSQNMTYDEVDEVEFGQTVALKTCYVDYFVQTTGKTALDPVVQSSRALRVQTEEEVKASSISYTLDELPDVVTLSNDSAVYTAIGYTPTGIDIANDNKLNETDIGNILLETPEDVDAKYTGTTVVKGWDSVSDSVDESIEVFLEERHQVSRVYVIDYYIDDMKLNVTVTEGMADAISKSALKSFMDLSEDEGAEMNYDDESGVYENWEDFDYAYMPRDITAAEWTDMKTDLSNAVRKDTVNLVAVTLDRPADVVEPMFERLNPFSTVRAMDVTGDLDVDTTYQLTNALIGSVLTGDEYTAIDAEDLDSEMESTEADGWDTVEDGKTTTSGLSLVTNYSTLTLWIIAICIFAISAVLVAVFVLRRKKRGKGKKKK